MSSKVWINLDPDKVDISVLEEGLKKYDCELLSEAVPGNDPELLLEKALQADIAVSTLENWNEYVLRKAAGKIRFIQKYGVGLDNINLKVAGELGIPVANVPGGNSAAVAEVALLHIMNCGRRFSSCTNGVKIGIWPSTTTGNELDGKIVGLMGYGNIARHLARLLTGFQVKILAYDPYIAEDASSDRVTFVKTPEELFTLSDIVSLHIPCTKETEGSINKHLFGCMKEQSILVNTCRGGVVNEADLVEALTSGKIKCAGLDVLIEEPPTKDNPLMQLDNVFITSHMGAASLESEERSQIIMANAIGQFLNGELPAGVRNKEYLK